MKFRELLYDFKSMPRNVKVCAYAMPLWAIPHTMYNSYASMFMLEQGISPTEVGFINSMTFLVKTLLSLFSAYIVNRLGRKYATPLIDFIGWAFPTLLFFFATEYWQFLLANLVNCVSVVNNVCTQCLYSEDVDPRERIKAFNYHNISGSVCGFIVPVTGLLIGRFGFLPTMRGVYLFSFISMSLFALAKLLFLQETTIGKVLKAKKEKFPNPLAMVGRPLRYIVGNRRLLFLFSVNILLNFAMNVNNLYYFPFLTDSLGYPDDFVSLFPFITTAISLVIYLFVIGRVRNMARCESLAIGLYVAGAAMLALSYYAARDLALACVFLWAVAGALSGPVMSTLMANSIDDEVRTNVLSVTNVLSMLFLFPAGYFGGWLYEMNPLYFLLFLAVVYALGFAVFYLFHGRFLREKDA